MSDDNPVWGARPSTLFPELFPKGSEAAVEEIRKSRFQSVRLEHTKPLFHFYVEGWKSWDKEEKDCPYTPGSPEAERWISGWYDARCEP